MENAVHQENKTQDKGLTWGSSARLNWEFWTHSTVSCTSQLLLPGFLRNPVSSPQEGCHHTENPDGRTFNGGLLAPSISCTSWKITIQFPRERAYTNRAKLLDGLSQQIFLNTLPSSCRPEVKVESFLRQRMPWPLSTSANTLSTKVGFFSSLILGNSIVQRPYFISWCTLTAEPKHWRGCFSPAFNEGWAQFPNTCDKPQVKTRFHHHLITPQGDYNTPGMFVPALWPQVLSFPPLPCIFSSIPKIIVFRVNIKKIAISINLRQSSCSFAYSTPVSVGNLCHWKFHSKY